MNRTLLILVVLIGCTIPHVRVIHHPTIVRRMDRVPGSIPDPPRAFPRLVISWTCSNSAGLTTGLEVSDSPNGPWVVLTNFPAMDTQWVTFQGLSPKQFYRAFVH
jgi:hypothetical protein